MARYPTLTEFNQYKCDNIDHQVGAVQITPICKDLNKIIIYKNCIHGLLAAMRRHVTHTVPSNKEFLLKLQNYVDTVIMPEFIELFQNFEYYYEIWYNHLTREQQMEIDDIDLNHITNILVGIFCKSEKQELEDPLNWPKNRSISAINAAWKYVMGPIVYAMEQYIKKMKGYWGGKNWEELGQHYQTAHNKQLFKTIQTDISGMDRSVTNELKQVVMWPFYNYIEQFVHHVDLNTFKKYAYMHEHHLQGNVYEHKMKKTVGSCVIDGTVLSGNMDTKLMNTLPNVILHRYVVEVLLNINKDHYELIVTGDDSVVSLPTYLTNQDIVNAYKQVFIMAKNIDDELKIHYAHHGCGMTLKYLQISENINDADFCSTECFQCNTCNTYRITRKLDRYLKMTPWSTKINNLPVNQQNTYKNQLYIANLEWMDGLPIFRSLNSYLQVTSLNKINLTTGKQKKQLPLTPQMYKWKQMMIDSKMEQRLLELMKHFDKGEAYNMLARKQTINKCCIVAYYDRLFTKLGLTRNMVNSIEFDIENADHEYTSPLLNYGLQYALNLKNKQCYYK